MEFCSRSGLESCLRSPVFSPLSEPKPKAAKEVVQCVCVGLTVEEDETVLLPVDAPRPSEAGGLTD